MKVSTKIILAATVCSLVAPMTAFAGTWSGEKPRWSYDESHSSSWEYIDGKWYYFDSDNKTFTGLLNFNGKQYYLSPDHAAMIANDWVQLNGAWYYFKSDGSMAKSEWIKWTGSDYYLGSDGKMLTNQVTPDGYYVDNSGKWVGNNNTSNKINIDETLRFMMERDRVQREMDARQDYFEAYESDYDYTDDNEHISIKISDFSLEAKKDTSAGRYLGRPEKMAAIERMTFDANFTNKGSITFRYLNDEDAEVGEDSISENGSYIFDLDEETDRISVVYTAESSKGKVNISKITLEGIKH